MKSPRLPRVARWISSVVCGSLAVACGGVEPDPAVDIDVDVDEETSTQSSSVVTCSASCSNHGACVSVAAGNTCACEPGYYAVGLSCLADPCQAGGSCSYVDSASGNDANSGSRTKPWKTLARVKQASSALQPGAYVLFRRGGTWSSEGDLSIRAMAGTEANPITFGAYGAPSQPRPAFRAVRIKDVSHVTLRDIESSNALAGPCIGVGNADHVIVQGSTAHHCRSNGIHFGGRTSYGTMIDNVVHDVDQNDALVVHQGCIAGSEPCRASLEFPETVVGDHFWIVDNKVPGPAEENAIDIATGDDGLPGSRDMKIVGNVLGNVGRGCIELGHGTSVAWVVGNTLGRCMRHETASSIHLGGDHGENSGNHYQVSGNVVFSSLMSSVLAQTNTATTKKVVTIENNTFIDGVGRRPTIAVFQSPSTAIIRRNIVWSTDTQSQVAVASADDIAAMDFNAYVPGADPACRISRQSLTEWRSATGFDRRSTCGLVPGVSQPTPADIADFSRWTRLEFLARFVPTPTWSGCASGVGAFDCSGKRRIAFKPFAGYAVNGGYGWPGPLVVQQRYRLPTR